MKLLAAALLCSTMAAAAPPPPMPNPGMIFPGDGRHLSHGTSIPPVPGTVDCAIRKAAWDFGKKLMPKKGGFTDLFDALQLANGCGVAPPPPGLGDAWAPPTTALTIGERVLFVEPASPSAAELPAGTFATVGAAVAASRSMAKPLTIALRDGVHYLSETVHLGSQDSGLTLRNAVGERAVLSGGTPLTPSWTPSTACTGCYEASLKGQVTNVPGLRQDGVREIRARYPNHDPELYAVIDGKYLVHDGHEGLMNLTAVNVSTWISGGAVMNGMNQTWPPKSKATTYVSKTDEF